MFSLFRLMCLQYVLGLLAVVVVLSAPAPSQAQRALAYPTVPPAQSVPFVGGIQQSIQLTQQMLVQGGATPGAGLSGFTDGLGGANERYGDLLTQTIYWAVAVSLVTLALFGQYQRLWTFVGQRDYEAVVKGLVVATLVIVGGIAFLHPVTTTFEFQTTPVTLPGSVIALFFLLALAFLIGARFLVHLVVEGRVRSFRAGKGARDVVIVGGGDGGRLVVRELIRNPQLRLRPVGFVDDDPRKQGMKDEHGLKVLGTTDSGDLHQALQ